MIADVEALFTLCHVRIRDSHYEVLLARLEPFAFDVNDVVSLAVPHKRGRPVGVAVAGIAGDQNSLKLLRVMVQYFNPLYPPFLGDFKKWGTPPNPRQEVFLLHLF